MPCAKPVNLCIKVGSDFAFTVTLTDAAGDPVNITGWEVRCMVRAGYNGPILLDVDNAGKGGITTDPLAGAATIAFTAAQTDSDELQAMAIKPESAVYDVEFEDPSGAVIRAPQGRVSLDASVTR